MSDVATDKRASPSKRGYGRRWQAARKVFLQANPLCVYCKRQGRTTAASVVDHITPHKNDTVLFWNKSNWQPLCTTCHNAVKQSEEHTGLQRGCAADGMPLDPAHHWNI